MVRLAQDETRPPEAIDGEHRSEHLGFTSGAVMQSVAALKVQLMGSHQLRPRTSSWELGSQLSSDGYH